MCAASGSSCVPRSSVLRTLTFRLTVAVSLAFTASTLALFGFIYWQIDSYETRRLSEIVSAGLAQLTWLSPAVLPRDIEEWQSNQPNRLTSVTLFAPDGLVVPGALIARPDHLPTDGRVHRVTVMFAGRPEAALVAAEMLPDGRVLVVQRSLAVLVELRQVVLRALLLGLVPLALLGLGAGTVLSLRTVRRLRTMHEAIERIMRGNLSERLPGSGPKDDLDRLSDGLNRMLDEIERLLGEVKSVGDNIAHDLRTPLTRMRMRLESARASERTPETVDALIESCLTDLDYSFGLVAALLRIAEIEAGRRKAGFRDLDLSEVAEEVGEIYAPIAAARDQALMVDAPPGARLPADHDLLIEAVANLVDNAIKFTPPGGTISIAVTREAGGPVLRVIDSGPGVPPDEHGLVLRRFGRGDKSRRVPGHGLGLNLVSAIAALHDCQLRIDDGPGGVFTLDCRAQQGAERRGGDEASLPAPGVSRG